MSDKLYKGPERRSRVKLEDESSLSVGSIRFWDLVLQKLFRITVSLKFIAFEQILIFSYICLNNGLIRRDDFKWIVISGLVTIIISSVYSDMRLIYFNRKEKDQ